MKSKLTVQQILSIPDKLKDKTIKETAEEFQVHKRTIDYWIKKLRERNVEVGKRNGGGRCILDKIDKTNEL